MNRPSILTPELRSDAAALGLRGSIRYGLRSLSDGNRRLYVDCPEHGSARPWADVKPNAGTDRVPVGWPLRHHDLYDLPVAVEGDAYGAPIKRALCPACKTWVPVRSIVLRGNGRSGKECGSACLNGRTSCDCKCMGLCHGAGSCGGH